MPRPVAGLVWIAVLALPSLAEAKGDSVPVLNVAPSCLEAREYAGDNRNLTYQGCIKDENDARAELTRKWAHFKPEDRRDCVAQGAFPMPSYVEILTCLEMSEEAGTLYNPDGTARTKPRTSSDELSNPNPTEPLGNLPPPTALPPTPPATEALPAPEGTPLAPGLGK
ncbi:MAG TPA: hypothetical protein VLZ74_02475 [Methylocella sp.]|nr:hypothetical protein [Methylocella sp.]